MIFLNLNNLFTTFYNLYINFWTILDNFDLFVVDNFVDDQDQYHDHGHDNIKIPSHSTIL